MLLHLSIPIGIAVVLVYTRTFSTSLTERQVTTMPTTSRRAFLTQSISCGAYIAGLAAFAPKKVRAAFRPQNADDVVTEESWGRIEKVADNMWAVISTPFADGDYLTVSNGGIIAGSDRVLIVEAYMDPKGAEWVIEWAKKLTGRLPTDGVITHYHADHSSGASAFTKAEQSFRMWTTPETNELVTESRKERPADVPQLENVSRLNPDRPTEIDLGDLTVNVSPKQGHTPSDVVIEVSEPHVLWCGDLYFHRMVPNYLDALPKALNESIATLAQNEGASFVPGHGSVTQIDELKGYQEFLMSMQTTIRSAFDKGLGQDEAIEQFKMPEAYEDYYIFSPQVIPRMIAAWYRTFEA